MTGIDGRDNVWLTDGLLGLGAGVGAVTLPPLLGLGRKPTRRTRATKIMSVGWYVARGVGAAAAALQRMQKK